KYYEAHALAAYDCIAALPAIEGARRVLAWIRRTKAAGFSARAAFTALDRHFFRTMDDLNPCLALLVEYNYIRWVPPPPRSGPGRAPSPLYEINPAALRIDPKRGNQRDSAYSAEHSGPPPRAGDGMATTGSAPQNTHNSEAPPPATDS